MANRVNIMGSEVAEGYRCKPKKLDPNKPIMHFKSHIFVCEGERCTKTNGKDRADELREVLKEMDLHRGKKRIKVSRSGCFGACRYRAVMNIYENTSANGYEPNNNIWLKQTHKYTKEQLKRLFEYLSQNRDIRDSEFQTIEMAEY